MSIDLDQFKHYYALADKLYEMMTPEQILGTLRMLALHLADYRLRFGIIERRDLLELVGATELTDEQTTRTWDAAASRISGCGAGGLGRRGRSDSLACRKADRPRAASVSQSRFTSVKSHSCRACASSNTHTSAA